MFPSFICRRPAERQLVREVVEEVRTIEDAFQILIENLDPPSDPQQEMLKLCRSDWQPGQPIDDFFYQLKSAATRDKAPLHMACLVLANQLPSAIRGPIQTWIGNPEHQEVTRLQAREFLVLIRRVERKRNTHDWGNRNLGAVKIVNEDVGKLSDPKFPNLEHRETPIEESKQAMSELDFGRGVVLSTNGRERKSSFSRSGNTGQVRNFTERSNANPRRRKENECWICGKVGHMSFNCFKGFCKKMW